MINWQEILALIILLTVLAGLPRIFLGPTRADRMLAAQLCGSASVAILILFGSSKKQIFYFDIALVFALLASVTVIAFVRLIWYKEPKSEGEL